MASIKSRLFSRLLRIFNIKDSIEKQMTTGNINTIAYMPRPPKILKRKLSIKVKQIKGKNVFTLKPKQHKTDKVILYLHGGAYIHNINFQHWRFLDSLIDELNCTIIFPEYPLAPEHTYKDSFEMLEPFYKELLAKKGSEHVILMGDSAGGGFALALAQKMKNSNEMQPSHIILLSPWLDISMDNPDIKLIDDKDLFLGIEGLRLAGKAYAGETDINHYLLSPINGPIDGLGKISLFIGTNDIFIADAQKFKALCDAKDISINYYEYEEMPHDWAILGFPESKEVIAEIKDLINSN